MASVVKLLAFLILGALIGGLCGCASPLGRGIDDMADSLPRLGHQSYCSLVKLGEKQWPADKMAGIELRTVRGSVKLKRGAELPWSASVLTPKEKSNGKVLWYFHGVCGNGDFTRGSNPEGALKIYEKFPSGKPVVVGISLGQDWLVNETLRQPVWDICLELQRTLRLPDRGNSLFGFSMGGFNALALYGDASPKIHFEKCVVVAPCLPGCDPYSSPEVLRNFYRQPPGKLLLKKDTIRLVKEFFPDAASWNAASPTGHPERYRNKPLLALAGNNDQFAFDLTAQQLAAATGARFIEFEGKHEIPASDREVNAIVNFLK